MHTDIGACKSIALCLCPSEVVNNNEAEAGITGTLCKNKKIAILTQTLTLTLMLTQTQNLTQNLMIIEKQKRVNEQMGTHSLLSYSL